MLVKRKKGPKRNLPKRQIMCYRCGSAVLEDDLPGEAHPPYKCGNCGANWPPTHQEEFERLEAMVQAAIAGNVRVGLARKDVKDRKSVGKSLVWTPKVKVTKKSLRQFEKDERVRDKELDAILSMDSREEPRGRKSDPGYDKARFHHELSRIFRERISTRQLVNIALPFDKSSEDSKLVKFKQALKRRKKHH
jgi:DNA-directed RNA polymerase subunit RPC12/RpoP